MVSKLERYDHVAIPGVLFLAFIIRVWGIGYDLPDIYHPDEPQYIAISRNIFVSGDLNPRFFNYPSLFFYIHASSYVPIYLYGRLTGEFQTPEDIPLPKTLAMGVTRIEKKYPVLIGRGITLCFGLGAVLLTLMAAGSLTRQPWAAIFAGLCMALAPAAVGQSRMITPDTLVLFFSAAALLASLWVYQQGKTCQYVMAGLSIGLAISCKYNGAILVVTLLAAHFLRYQWKCLQGKRLYLALSLIPLVFLITTPYALLDLPRFLADVRAESRHYMMGHSGMEGDTLKWYLGYMGRTGAIIYSLAAVEIIRSILRRSWANLLPSVFPIIYFVFINQFAVRNDRTFLPLMPHLFVLSASCIVWFYEQAVLLKAGITRRVAAVLLYAILAAALLMPASRTITNTRRMVEPDSRRTATLWIEEHLPPQSKFAIEPYSPWLDPRQFRVEGFHRLIDNPPQWYVENDFDYLVFSQSMFGRFFRQPERYPEQVSLYHELFKRFEPVTTFLDGGYEVRLYKISPDSFTLNSDI